MGYGHLSGAAGDLAMTALENSVQRWARAAGWLCLAAVFSTCTGSAEKPAPPSVILISIDTLRADRLGSYGAATNETPTLDRVAKQGIVYERAYSPSSWTLPSHRSMLTGLYPAEMSKDSQSLAEMFRAGGYTTAGFTGGGVVSERWGFARGFDTFYAYEHPSAPAEKCPPGRFDGAEVFTRARTWLRDSGRRPFFLFIHTYEVHDRCEFLMHNLKTLPVPDPGPSGRQEVSDYYAKLIARADHLLGALLDDLDASGHAADTVVVITSDHGESLWEHGGFGHGCDLKPYEEMVHVPLILRYPARFPNPKRIEQPVSNIAAVPTVLELAGLPLEPAMRGRALPGLGLSATAPPNPVFSDCGKTLAVWSERYKLIRVRGGAVEDELYDLEADPHETKNLAGRDTPWGARLRRFAADYSAPPPPREQTPVFDRTKPVFEGLDEKTRERLRALGYLQDDEH